MNERMQKALAILKDEWDVIVIVASRHHEGTTECERSINGNGFAVQQMLEDTIDEYVWGGVEEEGDDEQEDVEI